MIRFECTNEFACRDGKKLKRWAIGEYTIEKPSADLRAKLSCAHAAGVGVIVLEGLDEDAVEPDEVSLELVEAYEDEQLARVDELRKAIREHDPADIEGLEALRVELESIRLVHPVEVGP